MNEIQSYPNLGRHLGLGKHYTIIEKSDYDQLTDLIKLTKKLLAFADLTMESPLLYN